MKLDLMYNINNLYEPAPQSGLADATQPVTMENFYHECFFYQALSTINTGQVSATGREQLLLMVSAVEGVVAEVRDPGSHRGQQLVFSRMRYRLDIIEAGNYTIYTPWGKLERNNLLPGRRGLNDTMDVLHSDSELARVLTVDESVTSGDNSNFLIKNDKAWFYSPCLASEIGEPIVDEFCSDNRSNSQSLHPGYIGNPIIPHTISASARGVSEGCVDELQNAVFRVEGPPNAFGLGISSIQTNLFSIAGKLHTPPVDQPVDPPVEPPVEPVV